MKEQKSVKKIYIVGTLVTAAAVLVNLTGNNNHKSSNFKSPEVKSSSANTLESEPQVNIKPICDGTTVTSSCTFENVEYKTFIYHEAIKEQSHTEQVTTYKKEISDYCTLCNDGTYSPSCATGRGACSYHGGVAQWNAPRYSNVPVYSTKTVVDVPAQESYYEKVLE